MNHRPRRNGRPHVPWTASQQLQLFPQDIASPQHRAPCPKPKETMGRKAVNDLEPVQRIVPARGAGLPSVLGLRSVFEMGASVQRSGLVGAGGAPLPARSSVIVRDGGVIRHTSVREQDTDEWAEKERQRRARQKPPRPPKQKFKVKGSRTWAESPS